MCWSSRELRQQLQYGSFTQFTFAPSPSQSSLRQVNTHDYWHYYNYKLLLSEFSLLVSIILVKFPFRLNLKCNCNSFTEWYIRRLHNLISRLNCLIVTTWCCRGSRRWSRDGSFGNWWTNTRHLYLWKRWWFMKGRYSAEKMTLYRFPENHQSSEIVESPKNANDIDLCVVCHFPDDFV